MNITINLDTLIHLFLKNPEAVRFYPYRTAKPETVLFKVKQKELEDFISWLFAETKNRKDNHVLFAVETGGATLVVQLSDWNCNIGVGVVKKAW